MSSLREAVSSNRFHFSTTEGVGGRLSSGIYAAYDRVQQTDDATSHTPPPPPTTFSSFGDDGTLDAGHGTALSVYSTQDDGEEGIWFVASKNLAIGEQERGQARVASYWFWHAKVSSQHLRDRLLKVGSGERKSEQLNEGRVARGTGLRQQRPHGGRGCRSRLQPVA